MQLEKAGTLISVSPPIPPASMIPTHAGCPVQAQLGRGFWSRFRFWSWFEWFNDQAGSPITVGLS